MQKTKETRELSVKYLLDNFNTVYTAIEYANSFSLEYPKKPTKPILKHNHSSSELKEYNQKFDLFTNEMTDYYIRKNEYAIRGKEVNNIIVEYIKEKAEINIVPEIYREKVYSLAYQQGHSSGYSEVYNCLSELVDIFI